MVEFKEIPPDLPLTKGGVVSLVLDFWAGIEYNSLMMQSFVIVIFGATGDLAQHKLFPALYSLFKKGRLGEKFYIIGFSRKDFTDKDYRSLLADRWQVNVDPTTDVWDKFAGHIYYQQGFFDELKGYEELKEKLRKFEKEAGTDLMKLFYLATPPSKYLDILKQLQLSKLSEGGKNEGKITTAGKPTFAMSNVATAGRQLIRLAVEKPFGKDLENARELDKLLAELFDEQKIYRVDHYLAKETVQNMIAFRFANGIFEPVWNKNFIDHVQITFAEKKGVGRRGSFFDDIGILRDVMQNHLMQLVATVAMEQPKSFTKEAVRDARAAAIKAIRCIEPDEVESSVVRGQYVGYRNEVNVKPDSMTETFAAMRMYVDTPRFDGVPFYIRAGKMLEENIVEIKLVFIQTCHILFKEYGCPEIGNVLTIKIQPDEGIDMRVIVKQPQAKLALGTVDMKFSYKENFGAYGDSAYEKLLMDIFSGDQMLFNRTDELESSWKFISKIMEGWKRQNNIKGFALPIYDPDSWGPGEASELIEGDGRKWIK